MYHKTNVFCYISNHLINFSYNNHTLQKMILIEKIDYRECIQPKVKLKLLLLELLPNTHSTSCSLLPSIILEQKLIFLCRYAQL